jgi:hypothetical protein
VCKRVVPNAKAVAFPKPNLTETVWPVVKSLTIESMQSNLAKFTSFRTRRKSLSPFSLPQLAHIISPDYRSDVSVIASDFVCSVTLFVDWSPKPAVAPIANHGGKNEHQATDACTQRVRIQITKEYAPASLRELITITEFPHSWGERYVRAERRRAQH